MAASRSGSASRIASGPTDGAADGTDGTDGHRGGYAERLRLPWWLWLAGLGLAALLATEVWLGSDGIRAWLPYLVLLPAAVAGLWWLGRIRVAVRDGELRVDDARLPVKFVADVIPLDAEGRREVLGVGADPLAFVVQRPWVSTAVQIVLNDPADPTPYWVVSTRNPVRLATAVLAVRDADPDPAPESNRDPAPESKSESNRIRRTGDSTGVDRRPPLP